MSASIVGAGAVGSAIAVLLYKKNVRIDSIVSRSVGQARALGKIVRCRAVSESVDVLSPGADVTVLAVPDDSLAQVVLGIAGSAQTLRGLMVHVSGVHSTDVLAPLEQRGAMVGTVHPIQSFPKSMPLRDRVENMKGIWFGVEGNGEALKRIRRLVRILGGREILIPEGMKPLYHVACVFASNYVVTLLNAASEAFGIGGMKRRWNDAVAPLLMATVKQALGASPEKALTGPVVRADVHTLALHIEALQSLAPQLVPLYTVAAMDTARLARQTGRLTSDQFRALLEDIRGRTLSYLKTQESKEDR